MLALIAVEILVSNIEYGVSGVFYTKFTQQGCDNALLVESRGSFERFNMCSRNRVG